MAPRRKKQGVGTDDTAQPTAKRQKTSPRNPVPKRPNAPRHNGAVEKAAPKRPTTATSAPPHTKLPKPKRSFRQKQKVPPHKPAPPTKPTPPGLLSLPLEIKEQIFLYTSARDTARLRRVCKALDVVVRGSTRPIANQFTRKEMERIQQQFDEFASLKPPTDFDSLMEALRVWAKQRGIFEELSVQSQSLVKLITHLLNRQGTGATLATNRMNRNIVPWADVAGHVVWLHRVFEEGRTDMEHLLLTVSGLGLLSYNDCDKLFESVKRPKLRLSGRMWPSGTREQTTFPERTTPLLQYPLWSEHPPLSDAYDEQTNAFVDYLSGRPTMPLLEATHGNVHLTRYLHLPALPNEVSCYYLDAEWARKEANKLFDPVAIKVNPVRVSPLLIAALLETVMLF